MRPLRRQVGHQHDRSSTTVRSPVDGKHQHGGKSFTITGELKSKIDPIWSGFWSEGISNPLEVVEQLTYLLFIKGLDEAQTRVKRKANRTGELIENPDSPDGECRPDDATKARSYDGLRWPGFKNLRASCQSPGELTFDVAPVGTIRIDEGVEVALVSSVLLVKEPRLIGMGNSVT